MCLNIVLFIYLNLCLPLVQMIAKSNKLKQNHKIKRVLQSIILKTTDTADYMIKVKHKRNMYLLE